MASRSVINQVIERRHPKKERLQEPEELSPTIRDAFRLAQYNGIQGLSHVNQPRKPIPAVQEGVMMLQQVLSEGAQRPEALIRNSLRPEDHPRVIAKGEGDDSDPEQTAPLEVRLISSCLPHRCSTSQGMPSRPPLLWSEARMGAGPWQTLLPPLTYLPRGRRVSGPETENESPSALAWWAWLSPCRGDPSLSVTFWGLR